MLMHANKIQLEIIGHLSNSTLAFVFVYLLQNVRLNHNTFFALETSFELTNKDLLNFYALNLIVVRNDKI